jgi:hypothetical protein
MKLFQKKATADEFDKLEEEFWDFKQKINSLCELLGVAFGGHGGMTAKRIEKDKDKK